MATSFAFGRRIPGSMSRRNCCRFSCSSISVKWEFRLDAEARRSAASAIRSTEIAGFDDSEAVGDDIVLLIKNSDPNLFTVTCIHDSTCVDLVYFILWN